MRVEPFAGVTVIELGQFVAVPYCAQLLAEGGARVVKVEPHEGDPSRGNGPIVPFESRYFVARNRGKRSLPLDLRHPRAARVLEALLEQADVLLMNLRPGAAEGLGLGTAALQERFPRLVIGNVTAFGKEGPAAHLAGMDLVVQARSGLMAAMGRVRDGLPAAGDTPIADYMAAVLLAFGVSSALFRRESTGRGGEVDVSLLGAAMALQNNLIVRVDSVDSEPHAELRDWLAQARADGLPFDQQASRSPTPRTAGMVMLYYRTYATKDSTIAVACVSPGLRKRFLAATGLSDPVEAGEKQGDEQAVYEALRREAEARLAERTTVEWQEIFDAHGVPASPVLMPFELIDDEQAAANGLVQDVQHSLLGPVRIMGTPVSLDDGGFTTRQPTPPFGSNSEELLREFGLSAEEIAACLAEGAVRGEV